MAFCSEIVQKREVIKFRKTFEKEQQQTNKNGLKNKTGGKNLNKMNARNTSIDVLFLKSIESEKNLRKPN